MRDNSSDGGRLSRELSEIFLSALKRDALLILADPFRGERVRILFRGRASYYLMRLGLRIAQLAERKSYKFSWYHACYTKALVSAHRNGSVEALALLTSILDKQIAPGGYLQRGAQHPFQVMGGHSLSYAREYCSNGQRYDAALDKLFDVVRKAPRTPLGGLLYKTGSAEVYVDTIGMICPFLASYARLTGNAEALDICSRHILEFIARNLDPQTHLPFHAYHDPGASRLGLHGWGRGTGWYLLGLCDVAQELCGGSEGLKTAIVGEIRHVADTLRQFQKPNGNWAIQIPVPSGSDDLSATAFCAYGISRALHQSILDLSFHAVLDAAMGALAASTDSRGNVANSSAEAYGVGEYGFTRGVQPWSNGIAAAAAFETLGLYASTQ